MEIAKTEQIFKLSYALNKLYNVAYFSTFLERMW